MQYNYYTYVPYVFAPHTEALLFVSLSPQGMVVSDYFPPSLFSPSSSFHVVLRSH